jgi:predicted metalloprotease
MRMFGLRFENNMTYEEPNMVLFMEQEYGMWECNSDSGPFYCPRSKSIYGLHLLKSLKLVLVQGGDFATAYVAHEIGHHVQTFMGTSSKCDNCNKVNQKLKLINYL